MNDATRWVKNKIRETQNGISVSGQTPNGLLILQDSTSYSFRLAVLGISDVIRLPHVQPLFGEEDEPDMVINVPSKTIWSGDAIRFIHKSGASFGTFGDIERAAAGEIASSFRNKDMSFFIRAINQHQNVEECSYVYDCVFKATRRRGAPLTIAVVAAYNLSAEHVRTARTRFGHFDVIVKSSSHGSITSQASTAANSMGAEALTFGNLMKRLYQ